ncbi:MAG TPA: RNA ligase family protein, partial [Thermoguttaceae bacterium]
FPLDGSAFRASFDEGPVCLYGEGYGAGIQAAGKLYGPNQDFVLFDVKVGDWWLKRKDVLSVAIAMDLGVVPEWGRGTLMQMVDVVRDSGLKSRWYDGPAEGLVARPEVELFARNGQRIITKLKVKDFRVC